MWIDLWLIFVHIGLMSIGGGYASLPYIQQLIVNEKNWLSMSEYLDLLAISQMTPGPIAINAASFVGAKVVGFFGSVVSTVGFVTPAFIIVLTLAHIYYKYSTIDMVKQLMMTIRPITMAFIVGAVCHIFINVGANQSISRLLLIGTCLYVIMKKFKVPSIIILFLGGLLNLVWHMLIM